MSEIQCVATPEREHRLKTVQPFFDALRDGTKTFEVRKADRDFRVGDWLALGEWDPETECFTGTWCAREISYILTREQFEGIAEGYVVLGFVQLPKADELARLRRLADVGAKKLVVVGSVVGGSGEDDVCLSCNRWVPHAGGKLVHAHDCDAAIILGLEREGET